MGQYLSFNNLTKTFTGIKALDSVQFSIAKGSVHGLLGENGAGKSTLLKILSGFYRSDSGCIEIDGNQYHFLNPLEAIQSKIAVIPQELQLIPNQTVAENITLGKYCSKGNIINWRKMYEEVSQFLAENRIDVDCKSKISQLSIGKQQLVEIAKALYLDAKIVAFDEPTSSLSQLETEILFDIIRILHKHNVTIIYISHRLSEIFDLCDSCTILKDGLHILTSNVEDGLPSREKMISYMTGRELNDIYSYKSRKLGNNILNIKNVTSNSVPNKTSILVKEKEIVGIFGLIGAGRSELARLIYGAEKLKSGEIKLEGQSLVGHSPRNSILHGLMFCTEDRKRNGIIPGRPLWENINISSRRHFTRLRVLLNQKNEKTNALKQINSLKIKTSGLAQHIEYLSGGNQQKAILGRWLSERGLKILIIDEPTRGIDIGAKHEIYQILFSLAESGVGIIVISSELPEIMGICDRVYVMREGYISKEILRTDLKEDLVLEYAFPNGDKNV